jgi:uncharacterized paraquat-inducible protein A
MVAAVIFLAAYAVPILFVAAPPWTTWASQARRPKTHQEP